MISYQQALRDRAKLNAISVPGSIKRIKRPIKYLGEAGVESAQMTKFFKNYLKN